MGEWGTGRVVAAVVVAGAVVAVGAWRPWQHHSPAGHHVVYKVGGDAPTSGLITYTVPGGQQQANGAALPWSHTMDVAATAPGASVYVSVQNSADTGGVNCEIDIDGKTVVANASSGAYAIATCAAPVR